MNIVEIFNLVKDNRLQIEDYLKELNKLEKDPNIQIVGPYSLKPTDVKDEYSVSIIGSMISPISLCIENVTPERITQLLSLYFSTKVDHYKSKLAQDISASNEARSALFITNQFKK